LGELHAAQMRTVANIARRMGSGCCQTMKVGQRRCLPFARSAASRRESRIPREKA
jgi:hypothetical protein